MLLSVLPTTWYHRLVLRITQVNLSKWGHASYFIKQRQHIHHLMYYCCRLCTLTDMSFPKALGTPVCACPPSFRQSQSSCCLLAARHMQKRKKTPVTPHTPQQTILCRLLPVHWTIIDHFKYIDPSDCQMRQHFTYYYLIAQSPSHAATLIRSHTCIVLHRFTFSVSHIFPLGC